MRKLDNSKKRLSRNLKGIFAWVLAGIFIVVQVFFAIETSNLGSKLALLEQEEDTLSRQNREFSAQVVNSTSLTTAEGLSKDLGFIKPEKIIYIESEASVAKAP